jgi:hypothetical protein
MKIRPVALAALILLAASFPVPAKKSPARPFFLQTPITMDGAEIPQGMYQLTLESSNSSVRVTLWREGQFVATARGVWVKGGMKYTETSVLLRVNSDGSRSLIEIRLAGTAKTIVLDRSDTVFRLSAK